VIVEGKGAVLRDVRGRNISMPTPPSGPTCTATTIQNQRRHPRQLKKIAHSSALGLANEPAVVAGEKLVKPPMKFTIHDSRFTIRKHKAARQSQSAKSKIGKGFLFRRRLDGAGSRAQAGLRIHAAHARPKRAKPKFLSLEGAYHGDTVGAVSLGHIDLFHKAYGGMLFKSDKVMSPYCYRCPFNRAKPERADAREYRKCNWECVGKVEQRNFPRSKRKKEILTRPLSSSR
jgi:adenosylmethionine-8-amino-7-oxononanoate aminotransferase